MEQRDIERQKQLRRALGQADDLLRSASANLNTTWCGELIRDIESFRKSIEELL